MTSELPKIWPIQAGQPAKALAVWGMPTAMATLRPAMNTLRGLRPSRASIRTPVIAMEPNTVTVAPPRTGWGMVMRIALSLGTRAATATTPPAMPKTTRLMTLVVTTIPTF